MPFFILIGQFLCCFGLGYVFVRALRMSEYFDCFESAIWSIPVGVGLLGWLLFFLGLTDFFTPLGFSIVLMLGMPGLFFFLRDWPVRRRLSIDGLSRIQFIFPVLLIGLSVLFDVFEAILPPADADTLAYHFALPKLFLQSEKLVFVPRAADGAIPLLTQMTFLPVLALGGEMSLTLWAGLTGLITSGFFFFVSRKFFSGYWSVLIVLLMMTTPAVVFGAGTGQVEYRMALFTLGSIFACLRAIETGSIKLVVLSALLAGFAVATKFTGLIIALATILVLLVRSRNPKWALLFIAVSTIAGGQWYFWNWFNTGDPIFPMLFNLLDYRDPTIWDHVHQLEFRRMFAPEQILPKNLLGFLGYPFIATLSGIDGLDGSRTGMGPWVWVLVPFFILGLWKNKVLGINSTLFDLFFLVTFFYAIWFFFGPSQRVRHFLPIYPLLLIVVTAVASKWFTSTRTLSVLKAAIILVIIVQLSGQGVFSINHVRALLASETRDSFLTRNVPGYAHVIWINKNLKNSDRILVARRQLIYLIDRPVFYGHPADEARIDISPYAKNPKQFFEELQAHKITHILTENILDLDRTDNNGIAMWRNLISNGCGVMIANTKAKFFRSRTFSSLTNAQDEAGIIKLQPDKCKWRAEKI